MIGTVIACVIFCLWLVWPLVKLGMYSEMQCLKHGTGRDPQVLPEVNLGNDVEREKSQEGDNEYIQKL